LTKPFSEDNIHPRSKGSRFVGLPYDVHFLTQENPQPMSERDVIGNQKQILKNQKTILANQGHIKKNQDHIKANQGHIKANQETIKKNQAAILKNQGSLNTIIKNQEQILVLLRK
jgi:hypothetical protein